MRRAAEGTPARQRGAATLLVALMLMMSLTVVTLSVAHTQLVELRIASSQQWHARLSREAGGAVAQVIAFPGEVWERLDWRPDPPRGVQTSALQMASDDPDVETHVVLERLADDAGFVALEATSTRRDGSGMRATTGQIVRLLSVLSPLAENAPPLVVNGCVAAAASRLGVWPHGIARAQPAEAVWVHSDRRCAPVVGIDTHGGSIVARPLGDDLWAALLSVDRDTFAALAVQQNGPPADQRVYWHADVNMFADGSWRDSLGAADRPVVLYFPPEIGCPRFASGVRIYGLVFIDSACRQPLEGDGSEIYGILAINGDFNPAGSALQVYHIELADELERRLNFPMLRVVPVPGTWKDF